MKKIGLGAGLALMLTGCASVPSLQFKPSGAVATSQLIAHAICEVARASTFRNMQGADQDYVMVLSLTLKGEDNTGAAPSLSFVDPSAVNAAMFRSLLVSGEFSRKRERGLTEEVTVRLKSVDPDAACRGLQGEGDFGLRELLERRTGLPADKDNSGYYAVLDKRIGKFGSQVQFTVKWSVAGGPYFVRKRFKGSDKGLLNASRVDVSTLNAAFARYKKPDPTEVVVVEREARRLYQELLPQAESRELVEKGALSAAERQAIRSQVMAQAMAAAQERAAGQRSEAAEQDARNLINQMILQNLTITAQ